MNCEQCGRSLSSQEEVSYHGSCEDCFALRMAGRMDTIHPLAISSAMGGKRIERKKISEDTTPEHDNAVRALEEGS